MRIRQARAPFVPVAHTEQCRLTDDVGRRRPRGELSLNGLRNHETRCGPSRPEGACASGHQGPRAAERRPHPNIPASLDLDWAGRNVVGPQVEGAAACELEARVMPMACENAVVDGSSIERKAHMRAAVVQGEHPPAIVDEKDRSMAPMEDEPSLFLQLVKGISARVRRRRVHRRTP